MKNTDQLRLAGIVVLVLLVAVLFFVRSPSGSGPVSVSIPAGGASTSVSRTAADGSTWTLDQAGGGLLVSTDPNGPKAGPPILVKTDVIRAGPEYAIGLILEGQAGEHYRPVVKKDGSPVSAPTLRIVNEAGQVITQGDFQYG
ncbi:MAG: hypothetical protein MUC88_01490 [Planctomycetes bacterium]|jgi:hypothetical protein|nr:hypothetical protein [Planctomycetota bacterium]